MVDVLIGVLGDITVNVVSGVITYMIIKRFL